MQLSEYAIFTSNSLKESIEKNLPAELRKIFDEKMAYFAMNCI
ncbi:unnamed protein product, partial [marine sediment metagenome]